MDFQNNSVKCMKIDFRSAVRRLTLPPPTLEGVSEAKATFVLGNSESRTGCTKSGSEEAENFS